MDLKENKIIFNGKVINVSSNNYKVELLDENNNSLGITITAFIKGSLKKKIFKNKFNKIFSNDKVLVELNEVDPSKGIIIKIFNKSI